MLPGYRILRYRGETIKVGRPDSGGRGSWCLKFRGRVRFGTRRQIAEDLQHIRQCGGLPPSKAPLWG